MMRITKEADISAGTAPDKTELGLINQLSRRPLRAEELYTFSVRLCDNEIDRDGERFPAETLEELAKLFVGKSGIFDHQWSARGQTARIYRTELVREKRLTRAGDPYCYLKGYAYMLRTETNRDLIAEIEAGIKREVSVSCAVKNARCSICGGEVREQGACPHVNGELYGEKLCWTELIDASDAYEWSFVAVPAQPNAGVLKGFRPENRMERLEREAALGRKYLEELRREVTRLGGLVQPELDGDVQKRIAAKLEEEELAALKKAYQRQLDSRFPLHTQLHYDGGEQPAQASNRAFLI